MSHYTQKRAGGQGPPSTMGPEQGKGPSMPGGQGKDFSAKRKAQMTTDSKHKGAPGGKMNFAKESRAAMRNAK